SRVAIETNERALSKLVLARVAGGRCALRAIAKLGVLALDFAQIDLSLCELGAQAIRFRGAQLGESQTRLRRNRCGFLSAPGTRTRMNVEHVEARERLRDSFDVGADERQIFFGRAKLFVTGWKERRILRRNFETDANVDRTHPFAFDANPNRSV